MFENLVFPPIWVVLMHLAGLSLLFYGLFYTDDTKDPWRKLSVWQWILVELFMIALALPLMTYTMEIIHTGYIHSESTYVVEVLPGYFVNQNGLIEKRDIPKNVKTVYEYSPNGISGYTIRNFKWVYRKAIKDHNDITLVMAWGNIIRLRTANQVLLNNGEIKDVPEKIVNHFEIDSPRPYVCKEKPSVMEIYADDGHEARIVRYTFGCSSEEEKANAPSSFISPILSIRNFPHL